MKKHLGAIAGVLVFAMLLGGCSSGGDGSGGDGSGSSGGERSSVTHMTLSEAFCSDLAKGYTPFQILASEMRSGSKTPEQLADFAYGAAANECPTELQSNQFLRTYLQGWDINPDA